MDRNWLLEKVMMLVPLVLSLSVHEWAHAWSAYRLGDDTASRQGRLTLNPIAHIDPIGTLLLPLMGIPFGWARPVPVNPMRFRRSTTMRTGMMITAAAGPLSNVIIAILATVVWGLLFRVKPDWMLGNSGVSVLLNITIMMNVALALFNMLPFPPLDGSRVVDGLMPLKWRPQWEQVARYGWVGLLLAVVAGRYILAIPLAWADRVLGRLLGVVAGFG
ncbi:MAG TPA: site-2 protease family protein [Polyangiaceae bacterium]|nr:site-2 protease family protein [Polyangiaceae bacterium]